MTSPREPYVPEVGHEYLAREKARARELRASAWWRRRIAAGTCHYCGRTVGARALTADHVVPLIRGGRSVRSNMVPACKECNTKKQSMLAWEWEEYVSSRARSDSE